MKLYLSSFLIGNKADQLVRLTRGTNAVVVANALDNVNDSRQMRAEGQAKELRELGFDAEELDLRHYFGAPDQLITRLAGVDLVWVTGGIVFLLRRAMRQSGFDQYIIDQKGDDSLVYGGYSAGVCAAGPSLRGIHLVDDPDASADGYQDPVLWDGLGLVPYSIAPHYKSDHPESNRIDGVVEYVIDNKMPFLALRDGDVIITAAS